jgi:hypothetical protein
MRLDLLAASEKVAFGHRKEGTVARSATATTEGSQNAVIPPGSGYCLPIPVVSSRVAGLNHRLRCWQAFGLLVTFNGRWLPQSGGGAK